ncbi:MAG: hypothetical protein FJ125_11375 [Deltaproteobacteria bacterium]|nr:hypothetical protein [Deltaproteobacteria bacterium]
MIYNRLRPKLLLLTLVLLLCAAPAGPLGAEELLFDPLDGSTTGVADGGEFVEGGWRAPRQVRWDLGAPVREGSFSVVLRDFDPAADSA